ncbi:hypothetical protein Tco_0853889 [Tanacetum coccineum]
MLEKSHDPLALVAHTGSSSRNTSSYYVTHPTSVVDYKDEYQQDDVYTNSEDPLTSAMLLLARAITQNFSTPTNNRLFTSSNTRNQEIIQGDRVNIQSRNSDTFDYLFDYLQQFKKLVNVSRAKKLEKSHDPLALKKASHDDVHQNQSEDPSNICNVVTCSSNYLKFSTLTNNRLRTSSNTRNQAIIQGDWMNIQSRNSGNAGRNNRRAYVQEEIIEGLNAPNETRNVQRTLRTSSSENTSTAKQDEAENSTDEQNDFLFADASRMEKLKELSATYA